MRSTARHYLSKPTPVPDGVLAYAHHRAKVDFRRILIGQSIRTSLRIAFSGAAAIVLGRLVMGANVGPWLLASGLGSLGLSALAGLITDRMQGSAETAIASDVRAFAAERLQTMDLGRIRSLPIGQAVAGLQRYPTAIASLVIGHHAARTMMAVGPLIAAAALCFVSWEAALTVVALTPVMIMFFVLVGGAIRARAEAQEMAFGRLAGQFADRIRALPTILANDALAVEALKLEHRLDAYAAKTVNVLRIAFLNAGVIDFFAALSIAILAVFLGLGHLKLLSLPGFSDLQFWQSLFILMIAPEYFGPFRRFAEQYHAKAEGEAAAKALDRLLDPPAPTRPEIAAIEQICSTIDLPQRGLVALSGPSGSGKSTLLRRLTGLETSNVATTAPLAGQDLVWIATDSFIPEGTLATAISWNAGRVCPTRLASAAARLGLLDDVLLPGGLDAPIAANGANLSGGQRLRIAVARALISNRIVVADEPTAKLDARTALFVRGALTGLAKTRLVLVATHDRDLEYLADRVIRLEAQSGRTTSEVAA